LGGCIARRIHRDSHVALARDMASTSAHLTYAIKASVDDNKTSRALSITRVARRHFT
jgi:hypothetical protein